MDLGGEHCAQCNQLDYLPFKCPDCQKTFCGDHRLAHDRCSGAGATGRQQQQHGAPPPPSLIVCPICAKGVRVRPTETPDEAHARHSRVIDPSTGAPECDPQNWQRVNGQRPKCAAAGCRTRPLPTAGVRCSRCRAWLCLPHRLPEDHACEGYERQQQRLQQERERQGRIGRPTAAAATATAAAATAAAAAGRLVTEAAAAARKAVAPSSRPTPQQQQQQQHQQPRAGTGDRANTVAGTAAVRARALALPELCPVCPRAVDARFATVAELIEHCESHHRGGAGSGSSAVAAVRARAAGGSEGGGGKCVVS